jgi:hypothetical protein
VSAALGPVQVSVNGTASPADTGTFICCETPLPWPSRTEDRTCPECGTVWEHDGVDLGAGARIKPPAARPGIGQLLGPFATCSDALLSLRPCDGSFVGRESRFEILQGTLDEAGVKLGEFDLAVLRWLAGLDVSTVAAVAGWVSRAHWAEGAAEDTRRLGEIRALLARFDWEHDDRQYVLEAVGRIAEGGAS